LYNVTKYLGQEITGVKSSEEGTCGGKDGHRRLHALTTLVILMMKNILALVLTLVSSC